MAFVSGRWMSFRKPSAPLSLLPPFRFPSSGSALADLGLRRSGPLARLYIQQYSIKRRHASIVARCFCMFCSFFCELWRKQHDFYLQNARIRLKLSGIIHRRGNALQVQISDIWKKQKIRGVPRACRPRCGATTLAGTPCQAQALKNGRCFLHGGLITGRASQARKAQTATLAREHLNAVSRERRAATLNGSK